MSEEIHIRRGAEERDKRCQAVSALLLGGVQNCGKDGENLCAPRRAKAAAYFAKDHRPAQRPLQGVAVSPSTLLGMVSLSNHRHIGQVQEGKQSIAMLAIALAQVPESLPVHHPRLQLQDDPDQLRLGELLQLLACHRRRFLLQRKLRE